MRGDRITGLLHLLGCHAQRIKSGLWNGTDTEYQPIKRLAFSIPSHSEIVLRLNAGWFQPLALIEQCHLPHFRKRIAA